MVRLVFLDLDKTLIGDDYDPSPALPIIERLQSIGFKIVFNSSKTLAEQEFYANELQIAPIMVVENGGGIFVPKDDPVSQFVNEREGKYGVLKLGLDYSLIRQELDPIADEFCLKYYGNSSVEEVVRFTELPIPLARLAAMRHFSETIFSYCSTGFIEILRDRGLTVMKGSRFITVTGRTDKGKAARTVIELHKRLDEVFSVAIGDGENDVPMFDVVDLAIAVGGLDYKKAVAAADVVTAVDFIETNLKRR